MSAHVQGIHPGAPPPTNRYMLFLVCFQPTLSLSRQPLDLPPFPLLSSPLLISALIVPSLSPTCALHIWTPLSPPSPLLVFSLTLTPALPTSARRLRARCQEGCPRPGRPQGCRQEHGRPQEGPQGRPQGQARGPRQDAVSVPGRQGLYTLTEHHPLPLPWLRASSVTRQMVMTSERSLPHTSLGFVRSNTRPKKCPSSSLTLRHIPMHTNPKIQEHKQETSHFDTENVRNPDLRFWKPGGSAQGRACCCREGRG